MYPDRLRSIVPMFGGGDSFVETLEAIVRFVDEAEPSTDRLVQWHRDRFARVSSAASVMERVRDLESVALLDGDGDEPLDERGLILGEIVGISRL